MTGKTRTPAALVTAGRRRAGGTDFAAEKADGGERMKLGTVRVNGATGPGGPAAVTISGIGTPGSPVEIR